MPRGFTYGGDHGATYGGIFGGTYGGDREPPSRPTAEWRLYNEKENAYDPRLVDVKDVTLAYNRFARSATVVLDDPDGTVTTEYARPTPVRLEVRRGGEQFVERFGGFVNNPKSGQNTATLELLSHDSWLRGRDVYRSFGKPGDTAHLSFDGVDDNISTSDTPFDGFTALTIAAWAKTTATPTGVRCAVHKQSGSNSGFRFTNEGGVIEFGVYAGANSNGYTELNGSTAIDDGEWHLLVGTWDGSDMTVYHDASVDGTATQPDLADNNLTLGIGADVTNNINYWDGSLDDVRVYDRALSASEVQALYDGLDVTKGLVAHYKMDSGSGSTAVDSSGSADGTITGATWVTGSASPYDRGVFKSVLLRELVGDLTPLKWDPSRVNVYDDSRISTEWSGVPLDKIVEEIAGYSNDELFGATNDQRFLFEQRDSERAPRDFTAGEYFAADFEEDGSAELNEVTVYYGGNPASEAVVVEDAASQKQLQDELDAAQPVVVSDSKTFTEITTEQAARRKGNQILKGASAIRTGELTTWEAFGVEPGDLTRVVVPEQNVDAEFRVAELSHSWQADETKVKLAENSQGVVDTLVELSDEVSRVEARAADNNATIARFATFDLPFEIAFTLNAYKRNVPGEQFLFGPDKGGLGDPNAGGGLLGDRRGDRQQIL